MSFHSTMTIVQNHEERKESSLKIKHVGLSNITPGALPRGMYNPNPSSSRVRVPETVSIESVILALPVDDPNETVVELKNKLNFVKVEHQLVLKALHVEIEDLKRKNKDLQLQLVLHGFPANLNNSDAEGTNSSNNNYSQEINEGEKPDNVHLLKAETTPPDRKHLENNIKKLEADLQEARSRNIYLNELIDTQKKRLQDYELRESASVILDANILNSNAEGSKQTLLQQAQIPIHQHELEKQQPTGKTKQRRESMTGQSSLLASRSKRSADSLIPKAAGAESIIMIDKASGNDNNPDNIDRDIELNEYSAKLQEAEMIIAKLWEENERQRNELMEIRQTADRNSRMKFRGCNHPGSRRQSRTRKSSISPIKQRDSSFEDEPLLSVKKSVSSHHQSESQLLKQLDNDDFFPPLAHLSHPSNKNKRGRSPMLSELPPVPGSSGSESSSFAIRKQPLNLISMGESNISTNVFPSSTTDHQQAAKKTSSLLEQYRFSRSNNYIVGPGPLRTFTPALTDKNLNRTVSVQENERSKRKAVKLKSAISYEKLTFSNGNPKS